MLCARIDPNVIQLIGRWRSQAMFRYLHLQAAPLIHNISLQMLTGGVFDLVPNADLPAPAAALFAQIPPLAPGEPLQDPDD